MDRLEQLQSNIEQLYSGADVLDEKAELVFEEFKLLLNSGLLRAAEKTNGTWVANAWVKKGLLVGFRLGKLKDMSVQGMTLQNALGHHFYFFDKHTYPLRKFTLEDNVRIVPGGSTIRDGSYMAPGVICMPPMYVNAGAYVDEGTLIDSHALVGSCAQIGKRVHLSAAAQIGGVLEPAGALPVIIEDDVFVGGNCGVYEGTIVQSRAVLAAGVILTGSSVVYDLVNATELRATADRPLTIPENAVLVPGTRQIANNDFAKQNGLSLYAPLIIKYRDSKTDAKTALEQTLR